MGERSFRFHFLAHKARAIVKSRGGKNRNGAYIGIPKVWSGRTVKINLEGSSEPPLIKKIVATTQSRFTVSAPYEWIGKNVIIELIDKPLL